MKKAPEAPPASDSGALLEGIAQEAAAECLRLESEANALAAAKRSGATAQAVGIQAATRAELETRRAAILRIAQSKLAVERSKRALLTREQIERELMSQVEGVCAGLSAEPSYADTVQGWLVEGALALSVDAIRVRAAPGEARVLSLSLLRDAEKRVLELGGRPVRLDLADSEALSAQGLILESADGRLAYDTSIRTRMQRVRADLLALMDAVLSEAAPEAPSAARSPLAATSVRANP